MKNVILILILSLIFGCYNPNKKNLNPLKKAKKEQPTKRKKTHKDSIYTPLSLLTNKYDNFNSPRAINRIAKIENEYFNNYKLKGSKYYGTQWRTAMESQIKKNDSINIFKRYSIEKNNIRLDSMHCTIYAIEALKHGFGREYNNIQLKHKKIWKNREHAGWSIGYILTKFYNWKAYLIISKNSNEYEICMRNFKKHKKYHVWKQPNIRIEKTFDFDDHKKEINKLLNQNEFGWGFSNQGWHTWITRFNYLKECNWAGAPYKKYDTKNNKPLFLKTKFTEFYDYESHIIIFPPKRKL